MLNKVSRHMRHIRSKYISVAMPALSEKGEWYADTLLLLYIIRHNDLPLLPSRFGCKGSEALHLL